MAMSKWCHPHSDHSSHSCAISECGYIGEKCDVNGEILILLIETRLPCRQGGQRLVFNITPLVQLHWAGWFGFHPHSSDRN